MPKKEALKLFSEFHDPLPKTAAERRKAWNQASGLLELFSLASAAAHDAGGDMNSVIYYYQTPNLPSWLEKAAKANQMTPVGFRLVFNMDEELQRVWFFETSPNGGLNLAVTELEE